LIAYDVNHIIPDHSGVLYRWYDTFFFCTCNQNEKQSITCCRNSSKIKKKNQQKTVERVKMTSLGTGTGGGIKLVLWTQIHLFYQFSLQL